MKKERFEEICNKLDLKPKDIIDEVGFSDLYNERSYVSKPYRKCLESKLSKLTKIDNTLTRQENLERLMKNLDISMSITKELRQTSSIENLDNLNYRYGIK